MGYTKDLWTRPKRDEHGNVICDKNGKPLREPNSRWGKGKRWQANWEDPDGGGHSKSMPNKTQATEYWQTMESDARRGTYRDPKAGTELVDDLAERFLASRIVDPYTLENYERTYRLHIKPTYGRKPVKRIKPSMVQTLYANTSPGNLPTVRLVFGGIMELALADDLITSNPCRSKIVSTGKRQVRKAQAWPDARVHGIIDHHPDHLRPLPRLGSACGLRLGEQCGTSIEDIGDDELQVRRQVKIVGGKYVFALPKNDMERAVPLAPSVRASLLDHAERYDPQPLTLPWERPDGPLVTHRVLCRWHDGGPVRRRNYRWTWCKVLAELGVIPPPTRGQGGRLRYVTARDTGTHQLRHWYASVQLADGVNIRELAEFLGHHDPAFTMRVYQHMLPDSGERSRSAIETRMLARADHPDLAELDEHLETFYGSDGT